MGLILIFSNFSNKKEIIFGISAGICIMLSNQLLREIIKYLAILKIRLINQR